MMFTPPTLRKAMALDGCHFTNDKELYEKGVDEISVLLPANLGNRPALRAKYGKASSAFGGEGESVWRGLTET